MQNGAKCSRASSDFRCCRRRIFVVVVVVVVVVVAVACFFFDQLDLKKENKSKEGAK
jgi:hypothetical protein